MLIASLLIAALGSLVCSAAVFTDSIPGLVFAVAGLAMLAGYLVLTVLVIRQARADGKSMRSTFAEVLRETGRFLRDFMPA